MSDLASVIIGEPDDSARIPQLRQGVVTQASPLLVRVGSSVTATPCNSLGSYAPTVDDVVSVLVLSGDRLVLGKAGGVGGTTGALPTTFHEVFGGATGPILANSTYTPFTLTVPAVAWPRIVTAHFQYFLQVGAGGSASVELHHSVGAATLSSVAAIGGASMSVSGSYTATVAAGATFPMYLLIKAVTSQTNVFADAFSNRLMVVGHPA